MVFHHVPLSAVARTRGIEVTGLELGSHYGNMGRHSMKTTIEIADDLFERVQRVARKEKTTFRALTEQGLRLVLHKKQTKPKKLPPLVTVPGALREEFENAPWEKVRDEIYKERGA